MKKGWVYVLQAGDTDFFKIGMTTSDVKRRKYSLQAGCPYQLNLFRVIEAEKPVWLEFIIQRILYHYHRRGDWFLIPESDVLWFFETVLPVLLAVQGHPSVGTACGHCERMWNFIDDKGSQPVCGDCRVVYPIGIYSTRDNQKRGK